LIACQRAKSLGATVIGTVGNDEKAKVEAHYPIVYTREDFVTRIKEITRGQKLSQKAVLIDWL
jgi:NADPH:quinone reductase